MGRKEGADFATARTEIDNLRASYDAINFGGMSGSEQDQDLGNWVRDNEHEWTYMRAFIEELRKVEPVLGKNVLVPGCSDGLVSQVLAEEGYTPIGFDLSSETVKAARQRFALKGLLGIFYEDDITDLDLPTYHNNFTGVIVAHVAPCIPVVGEEDALLKKAIEDTSSLAPNGPYYLSTTYYSDSRHTRELVTKHTAREVTYYRRPVESYIKILQNLGRTIIRQQTFTGIAPRTGLTYFNNYILAGPQQNQQK
jgi:2-polyprenyl-3-methyl-5-hydroxy-6-metoxy-1,4-benzoquinol methylase